MLCRISFIDMLNVIMLSAVMLYHISFIDMLNVIMLSVIMPKVVAPLKLLLFVLTVNKDIFYGRF